MTRVNWRLESINPSSNVPGLNDSGWQISVIIPAFNEEPNVAAAVASAWAAGATEVIVVDGGSSDRTCDLAGQAGAKVFTAPVPGRGSQQAYGVEQATGNVLVFLHADSFFEVHAFATLLEMLDAKLMGREHNDCVAWGCFQQHIEDGSWKYRLIERGNNVRVRVLGWVYGDQGLWATSAALQSEGGFPLDPLMEDLILSRRLSRYSRPRICSAKIFTSARRWQRDGMVRRTLKNWWFVARYLLGYSTADLAKRY